jgi:DNA-binding LacI/PurR family transcriptional regulator
MATIRDVALRAGVSKATVSYIVNGRAAANRIPEETRERVLAVVRELNYHPNGVARSLAYRRSDTIAVVMQFPAVFSGWSGFTNEMMHGATDAAVRLGYDVLLHTRQPENGSDDSVEAEASALTDGRVDGALLLRDMQDPLASVLHARGFPTVLMFTRSEHPDLWFVDCDNRCGARMATGHLIGLGHRRILHLAGPIGSGAGYDRRLGYGEALAEAGLPIDPAWTIDAPYAGMDFAEALHWFEAPCSQRPTAVFAWSDDVAITLIGLLRARGLSVPDDVAVVGFDSTALCDHIDPPLTSVRQPIYEMADRAFALVTDRIQGRVPDETRVFVAPELVVRRSCGASTG